MFKLFCIIIALVIVFSIPWLWPIVAIFAIMAWFEKVL